ncbi:MAG: two-component regulator propeller domain-containing protein [Alphaproteobacteria bacterium]|nr:two-component regulator propeller domain-containing protein [Alphaproteobacteria bacterium]
MMTKSIFNIKYLMIKPALIIFLATQFIACEGQDKQTSNHLTEFSKPFPQIIKKNKSIPMAPDFDTTLVSPYIRSIFQDSKGNLWFGTIGDGVVRYDGKTLTYFGEPDGFINQTVYAINEDHHGNLWFGTDTGVYKFDGKTFKNYNQKQGLFHLDITRKGILVDKSGAIWIGTHGGVYKYKPSADTVNGQCFYMFKPLSQINIAGIFEDNSGKIWFATSQNGVFLYDGEKMAHIGKQVTLGQNYAGGIAQDKAGTMWFTTRKGIAKYDGKILTEYTAKNGLGGTEIWGIYIENSGIIWITARGSTTRFNPSIPLPNPKAFTVFTPADGLNCCVQSMYQDKMGTMWWGTGSGLYRFNGVRFYQVKKNGPW